MWENRVGSHWPCVTHQVVSPCVWPFPCEQKNPTRLKNEMYVVLSAGSSPLLCCMALVCRAWMDGWMDGWMAAG